MTLNLVTSLVVAVLSWPLKLEETGFFQSHKLVILDVLTVALLGKRCEEIGPSGNWIDGRMLLLVRLLDKDVTIGLATVLHCECPVLAR